MKISIDTWEGPLTSSEDFESTDVAEIDSLIRRLDQKRHATVSIGEPEKRLLMVGGGKGDYIVTATLDGENWFTLATGPPSDSWRRIFTGQQGDYRSHIVATLDQAIAAARYFFLH